MSMFWRRRKHSDFQAEIRSHIEIESDELAEEGSNPDAAKYQNLLHSRIHGAPENRDLEGLWPMPCRGPR